MGKNKSTKILGILLAVAVIVIGVMSFFIYKLSTEKAAETGKSADLNNQVGNLEGTVGELQGKLDAIANIINSSNDSVNNTTEKKASDENKNTITSANQVANNNSNSNSNNTVKYQFESGDNLAAQGKPGIVKIFEINDNEMKFEYNQAFDINNGTNEKTIAGTANKNQEGLYEYKEDTNGYRITIEFSEDKINLKEYKDENLISERNLWK